MISLSVASSNFLMNSCRIQWEKLRMNRPSGNNQKRGKAHDVHARPLVILGSRYTGSQGDQGLLGPRQESLMLSWVQGRKGDKRVMEEGSREQEVGREELKCPSSLKVKTLAHSRESEL